MKNLIKPLENVIYTFAFPGKKNLNVRFYGNVTDSGKFIFYDVDNHHFLTKMTTDRFTYLMRKHLVSKRNVNEPKSEQLGIIYPPIIFESAPPKTDAEELEELKQSVLRNIYELCAISADDRKKIKIVTKIDVNELINEWRHFLKSENPLENDDYSTLIAKQTQVTCYDSD